jgi:hypothetical protein
LRHRLICSARTIDTSSLRSTKTLGQRKKANEIDSRKERDWDVHDSDNEHSADPDPNEDDDGNDKKPEVSQQATTHGHLDLDVVGAALRTGTQQIFTGHSSNLSRRNRHDKTTWRQRLESAHAHIKSKTEDSDHSDSSISSPSESEVSDWSGFSSDDEDDLVEHNSDVEEDIVENDSQTNTHPPVSEDEAPSQNEEEPEALERFDETPDDGPQVAHQRAKSFKIWAREQSGLNSSHTNLSSIPVHRPEQRQTAIASGKPQPASPDIPLKEPNTQRVNYDGSLN